MSGKNTESGNVNLGMYQLVTQERERLGVRFVCDHEIWQSEDTALPGYEGYEHFTVARGFSLLADDGDSFQMISQATRECYPTKERREEVFECGYEFISIMKLAALSIGATAVYGKSSFSDLTDFFPHPETDLFWQHFIQSWISLGMASDRLRTFFIEFVRCESEKKLDKTLKNQLKQHDSQFKQFVYTQAFREFPTERLSTNQSKQRLTELQGFLESIATIRSKRNNFVHRYASREAMIVAAQRDGKSDHADIFKAFKGDKHTSDYTEELADAYKVLVRTGNLVFSLEKDVTENYGYK
ncbi:hypothetical protein [Methylocucumis oryzae]|uniref:Uncharacterized protein n=1 Tax=Methylocucumis oryzae TaxID=1632867 RepID=A0A0F3IPZ7_9GAMM|nr:hypothetical protein [Methylocucumis oryzae]KJV07654.1 hypothetical protein VZ94_03255 [Methylocucumis oryzae]